MTRVSFFFCSLHAEPHSSTVIRTHQRKTHLLTLFQPPGHHSAYAPYAAEMLTDLRPDVFLKVTSSPSSWPALLFRWQTTMRQRRGRFYLHFHDVTRIVAGGGDSRSKKSHTGEPRQGSVMCGAGKPCSALVTGKCLTRAVIWRGNRWERHWHAGGTCWLAAAAVTRLSLHETTEVINRHWSVAKGGGVCCFYPSPISADVFPLR